MKKTALLSALIVAAVAISASAQDSHSVKGYTKKDGTYVAPHKQTDPDKSKSNNWSSKGNVNPNTGKPGTKDPEKKDPPKKK